MDIRAQRVDAQVEGMPHQEDDREGDEPGDPPPNMEPSRLNTIPMTPVVRPRAISRE